MNPLIQAIQNNNPHQVRLLIELGHDGVTLLFNALFRKDREVAEMLINNGIDVNTKDSLGQTPLFTAAKVNFKEAAELLISKGADVNSKNKYNETPIFFSIQKKLPEVFNLLIDNGADLEVQNASGYSLLHSACYRNAIDCTKILIEKGLDVNIKDNQGKPPIAMVSKSYQKQLFELLLSNGAKKWRNNLLLFNPNSNESIDPSH